MTCYDAEGRPVPVPPDSVLFRPAVYGILIEHEQVLLARHPVSRKWHPPGCILSLNQTPVQAIRRYFRRSVDLQPRLGPLLYLEDQYRYDENQQAWHLSVLYYALARPTTGASALAALADPPATELISLAELKRDEMQFGYEAIRVSQLRI